MSSNKKKSKVEFSKLIVIFFVFIFLWGVIVGTMAVLKDIGNTNLEYFLVYMGIPASAAVSFYFWKAKNENMIKIEELRKKKKLKPLSNSDEEYNQETGLG